MDCYDIKNCIGECDNCEIFKDTVDYKLDLLNSLHDKVTNFDCDGEICNYVMCPVDKESIRVLKELGYSNEWIATNTENNEIDLTHIGFKLGNWWDSEEGFLIQPQ